MEKRLNYSDWIDKSQVFLRHNLFYGMIKLSTAEGYLLMPIILARIKTGQIEKEKSNE